MFDLPYRNGPLSDLVGKLPPPCYSQEFDTVKATLAKEKFQGEGSLWKGANLSIHSPQFICLHSPASTVVYDINGRESAEAKPVLEGTRATLEQYIYCSSAGVYLKSDQMPHRETDATDVKSRHKGKLDTESYLKVSGSDVAPHWVGGDPREVAPHTHNMPHGIHTPSASLFLWMLSHLTFPCSDVFPL